MEHRCAFALENQAIAEFSADDEKKWDPEKSWGSESFAEADAETETIYSCIA
jgi:hypothetical protein